MSENNTTVKPGTKQPGQMGRYAPFYDLIMIGLTLGREKQLRQITIKQSQIKPGDKVLEIGSGTGTLTLAAKAQVGPSGEVTGLDIAPEMVARARKKASKRGADVTFQEGSIAKIPFPDNRFDAVMCSFMIFHMPEDVRNKGLAEIYRVLKPGGHYFVIDTDPVDTLVPILKENSIMEIETGTINFTPMKLSYLRGMAIK